MRGQLRLASSSPEKAADPLHKAVTKFVAAQAPWRTGRPLSLLASLSQAAGEHRHAEQLARQGLVLGGDLLEPREAALLALQVADACFRQRTHQAATADFGLLAAAGYDGCGPDYRGAAARARLLAADGLRNTNRHDAAVELLESALPELDQHCHTNDRVDARQCLYFALRALGRHEDSARAVIDAASLASGQGDLPTHGLLSYQAGLALKASERTDDAERAFERTRDLWRHGGVDPRWYAYATRELALLRPRRKPPDWYRALRLLEEAQSATAGRDEDGLLRACCVTQRSIAALALELSAIKASQRLTRRGLAAAKAAAAGFHRLGDHVEAAEAELIAAEFEARHLHSATAARARAQRLLAIAQDRHSEAVVRRCVTFLAALPAPSP
jgi:hypothetical protein